MVQVCAMAMAVAQVMFLAMAMATALEMVCKLKERMMAIGDKKCIVAIMPRKRYVYTGGGVRVQGIYWLRYLILTKTRWGGWVAFADDNDD
jgi:hypothetical protein